MNKFINDAISLRGSGQVMRAAYMIQGAKIDKASMQNLVRKLNSKSMFTNAVLTRVEENSLASGSSMLNAMSDIYIRLDNMFSTSNAVSLLIENNNMILSSEIKKIEAELNTLEKAVDNYSFLLADGLSYDSSFLEPFSDDTNADTENLFNDEYTRLPDRAGLSFMDYQVAHLSKDEGIINIPGSTDTTFPLSPSIVASNCDSLISTPYVGDIKNTVDYANNNGWKISVDSATIISNSLDSYASLHTGTSAYPGAQFILQYEMPDENPVDTLMVESFCDMPFELLQVKGFTDDKDQLGKNLLYEPIEVSGVKNIIFPKNSYKKFHLYLRQEIYIREVNNPLYSEADARRIREENIRHNLDPTAEIPGRSSGSLANYKVSKLQPYWKKLFGTIRTSVGSRNSELFNQGIPSNWSMDIKLLERKDSSISEDENEILYFRDDVLKKSHINDSYLQSLLGRFFGSDNGSVGAFFKVPKLETYNTGSPLMEPENQVGSRVSKRFSPYPRLGDDMQLAEGNTYSLTEAGNDPLAVDKGWISTPKWDMDGVDSDGLHIWLNNPRESNAYTSLKQWLWDKYIDENDKNQGDWHWSTSSAEWVEGNSSLSPAPKIFPEIKTYESRIEYPWQPPSGGDSSNMMPTARVSDIRWRGNNSYMYRYTLGIKHVKAKLLSYRQKAIYISKPINLSGDLSSIKIKDSSTNFIQTTVNLQQNYLTSVEYSVTNDSNIYSENNWIPILPSGTTAVYGERLFLSVGGNAFFRFAAKTDGINIYKNGLPFSQQGVNISDILVKASDRNVVQGVKIPINLFSSTDIFTCDYIPDGDKTAISFDNYSITANMISPYFDENGQGEGFYGNGKLDFYLSKNPFIDMQQVKDSTYSDFYGLLPYEPLRVIFDDQSTAINLTSYNRAQGVSLDRNSNEYYYIHSGNSIIFNKPVNKNFRVYYNYFPTNLRFRAILRSNSANRVSPKIDFVQIKTKTRKPDPQRD